LFPPIALEEEDYQQQQDDGRDKCQSVFVPSAQVAPESPKIQETPSKKYGSVP